MNEDETLYAPVDLFELKRKEETLLSLPRKEFFNHEIHEKHEINDAALYSFVMLLFINYEK